MHRLCLRGPRRSSGHAQHAPVLAAALFAVILGGCVDSRSRQAATTALVPAPAPTDPVVAFAAQAQPGQEWRILLADGQSTPARLARSYHAASGRECREVLLGTGAGQQSQLVCQAETGGWVAARPLLRGGGASRP